MGESTLIVARPGRLRDALSALLTTIPGLRIVGQADDGPSVLRMVAERHPTLVLLDSTLPDDEVKAVVRQIKAHWPQIRCIVLAGNPEQQQIVRNAGADEVLLKGYPAATLLASLEKLLFWPEI
jgi:DNA-binding NarL/FixJ family response regulator